MKPCPFCEGEAILDCFNDRSCGFIHYRIRCQKCGERNIEAYEKETAIEKWNTRPPSLEDMLGELERLGYYWEMTVNSRKYIVSIWSYKHKVNRTNFVSKSLSQSVKQALEQIKENDNA